MALDALLFVLLLLALGKACAHWRVFPENAAEVLNLFALYLCLPAAVLRYVPRLQLSFDVLGLVAIPWLLLAASVLLIHALARRWRLRDDERAVLLLCVPLGNTSFLGYPLTQALLGEAALPYAVIYDQFGSFLILSTYGLWVLARYGGDVRPSAGLVTRRILRFPPFLALVLALSVMPATAPTWLDAILQRLADALLPVVALAVGLRLKLQLPREELRPLAAGLALKLVLLPLFALGLAALSSLAPAMAAVATLESAMPPMITAGALAISHRLAPGLAAALVGYGTLLALLTLPSWAWLLR